MKKAVTNEFVKIKTKKKDKNKLSGIVNNCDKSRANALKFKDTHTHTHACDTKAERRRRRQANIKCNATQSIDVALMLSCTTDWKYNFKNSHKNDLNMQTK